MQPIAVLFPKLHKRLIGEFVPHTKYYDFMCKQFMIWNRKETKKYKRERLKEITKLLEDNFYIVTVDKDNRITEIEITYK